ncbi:hypothetical protein ACFW1P_02610 [Paenibacillus sp. NPDC058910]|uniref:hypothetical protein n=1 Tax=unclassified Paenibacillus TaxID=185978 RepID=UPI003677FA1A
MIDLKHFAGHVPSGAIYDMDINQLRIIVDNSKDELYTSNASAIVSIIALVAYFESFCKNNFAAAINICPRLLERFLKKRKEINIALNDILFFDFEIKDKIGFIISEVLDFGTAKTINSLYQDLLIISPFSSYESKKFDKLLNDRNLLVHHGGMYTTKYYKQHLDEIEVTKKFLHSETLRINKSDFYEWADFLDKITDKTRKATKKSIEAFINENKIELTEEALMSLKYFSE